MSTSDIKHQESEIIHRVVLIAALIISALALGHFAPMWLSRMGERGAKTGAFRPARVPLPSGATPLSAGGIAPGRGKSFVRYRTSLTPAQVEAFLQTEMPAAGWTLRPLPPEAARQDIGAALSYSNRQGDWCMISVTEAEGGAVIAVLHMRQLAKP